MKHPSFEINIKTSVFSELFGFVLTDTDTLDHFHGGEVLGRDKLSLYTATSTDNSVAQTGVTLPILNVEPGYYSVVLSHNSAPAYSLTLITHHLAGYCMLHLVQLQYAELAISLIGTQRESNTSCEHSYWLVQHSSYNRRVI